MNFYQFGCDDPARASWVLCTETKSGEKRKPSALPPAMLQFFGPPAEGTVQMKPRYEKARCSACRRYAQESVFKLGFEEPFVIRIKGDFGETEDRMLVVSDRFLRAIQKADAKGYKSKPLGKSGWHALLVTKYVDCRDGVYQPRKPICKVCKLPNGSVGAVKLMSDIKAPRDGNTFFTTKANPHRMFFDREIFIGEPVLAALKAAGIKGGYANRLWTDEEAATEKQMAAAGKKWKPKGVTFLLKGK